MAQHLNILVQSSDYYAPFAGVMLTSLFKNNQTADCITVYLITLDMSETNKKRFNDLAEQYARRIKFLDAHRIESFLERESVPRWKESYATYYKIFALQAIEEDIDRLIYLDSDMLVVDSLDYLMNVDLKNNVLGMCIDSMPEVHKNRIGITSQFYYNAGMIVFDVKRWESKKCTSQIINHMKHIRANYPVADQDLINVVLSNDIFPLPIVYNVHTYFYIYRDYDLIKKVYGIKQYYSEEEFSAWKDSAVVFHCFPIMTLYPWNKGNVHPKKDLWNDYKLRSPWADFIPIRNNKECIYTVQRYCFKFLPHGIYAFIYRTLLEFALWIRTRNKDRSD